MEFEHNNVKDVNSGISEHFNHTRHYKWKWIEKFLDTLPEKSLVCDIGCGNGRNMTRESLRFKGVENCPEFIDICTKQGMDVVQADMCSLPFEDNSFDAIISIASFHHLSTPERRALCLKEMLRIMKPGAQCIVSVWSKVQPPKTKRKFENYGDNMVQWKSKDGEKISDRYYYIFKVDEIQQFFLDNGFIIINYEWDCGNEVFILEKN